MQLLRFTDFVQLPDLLHLARTRLVGDRGNLHTHDFAEIFWIQAGHGVHQVNGHEQRLEPGMLIVIRPSDVHDFQGSTREPMTLTNLAFPAEALTALQERYALPMLATAESALPPTFQAPPATLARIDAAAEELLAGRDSRLQLDRFLLNLVHALQRARPAPTDPAAPPWLQAMLEKLRQPQHFRQGPPHLAELTGRSHEHVARVLKRSMGLTPTTLLNKARLDHAARQLLLTDDGITNIAFDAGFGSIGHFYACFKERYACTPRQYRLQQQLLL